MRVLHLINDLRPAGAEMLVRQLAPSLQNAGVDVQVALCADTPSFLRDELADDGVPFHVPPKGVRLYEGHKQIAYLSRLLRQNRYDIVHVHLFPAQLWAALAFQTLPKTRRPLLLTTEHNTHNRRRDSKLLRVLDRAMYARYAHIVAITEATKTSLCDWVPPACAKTSVVPNGVQLSRMENAVPIDRAALLGLSDTDAANVRLITCVGRLEEQKNQATLLHALTLLPGSVHAVLVGVGEKENELRTLADELNLSRRVHFLGRRSDVPAIVAASDVYVQPSLWEGFGIAAVEALAAGVPVVVSDVPGLRDVVGDAARKFEAGNAPALARQLEEVFALSPLERAAMGKRGQAQARQFSIEACADAHRVLYEEVFAQAFQPPPPAPPPRRERGVR